MSADVIRTAPQNMFLEASSRELVTVKPVSDTSGARGGGRTNDKTRKEADKRAVDNRGVTQGLTVNTT